MAESLNIATLLQRREVYRTYLALKVREQDWHGVADAANDLRELDAMLSVLADIDPTATQVLTPIKS